MDIHEKSVNMDMHMDCKFHIHDKPANNLNTKTTVIIISVALLFFCRPTWLSQITSLLHWPFNVH